jgi:kynurenine 3-monooxygenase
MSDPNKLSHVPEGEFITIVGAGLAGCMSALLFAKRGFYVRLLESRPDFRTKQDEQADTETGRLGNAAKRSINLSLATRGKIALRRCGLYEDLKANHMIPMPSRTIHSPTVSGLPYATQPYGVHDGQCLWSVSRQFMNEYLLKAAMEHENVKMYFNAGIEIVNGDGSMLMSFEDGIPRTLQSKFTIGCDGAYSKVRDSVVRLSLGEVRRLFLDVGYKEILIPADAKGGYQMGSPNSLHVWPTGGKNFMVAMPNLDGSWTCTMIAKFNGDEPGELAFNSVTTESQAVEFFQKNFPDVLGMVPDAAAQFLRNPASPLMSVWLEPYHHEDKVLCLGDAAHAVTPFFGQGMNSSFEDACLLDELFDEYHNDVKMAFAEFSKRRVRSGHALTDLCIAHGKELGEETGSAYWLFKRGIGRALNTWVPQIWTPFMTAVAFSRIPYDEAVRLKSKQEKILDYGLMSMGLAAAAGVAYSAGMLPSSL